MAKGLLLVSTLLILCFGGLAVLVYVTRDEDAIAVDNLLAEDLTRAIGTTERDDDGRVVLSDYTRFRWDQVLLVAPRTSRPRISQALGYEWQGDTPFGRTALLIFLEAGKVARFADYRGEGVFAGFDTPIARIPRARATFRVRGLVVRP